MLTVRIQEKNYSESIMVLKLKDGDVGKNGLEGVDEMAELMRKRKKCVNIF